MNKTLKDKMRSLPKDRQSKINRRADELLAAEMTLRDLRKALSLTQVELSKKLHLKQDGISRIEQRSDMLISTLRKYVNGIGGDLKIVAEFPNRAPVEILGITDEGLY